MKGSLSEQSSIGPMSRLRKNHSWNGALAFEDEPVAVEMLLEGTRVCW